MRNNTLPYFALLLAVIALLLVTPTAFAQDEHMCAHDATIASLHHCVMHAATVGHIDNQGVANSLLKKLDAAQAALDRGQSKTAVNLLNAFNHAVAAQANKHIAPEQAAHMVMHAQEVIAALR
jgi:hypothetical protein